MHSPIPEVPTLLSERERLLQASARELARRELAPRAAAIDASSEFPRDVVELFRAHDFYGLELPEVFGGGGCSLFEAGLVYRELAAACLTSSVTLADQKLGADPLVRAGSDALRQRYLPAVARGERLIAFALTEPGAGSDIAAIETRAERVGDDYHLSGRKCFITNGGVADLYAVFATTQPGAGRAGLSCFLVPADAPGFSVGKVEQKMGLRGSPTAELLFDDCRIPADHQIGTPGAGYKLALQALDPARVVVAFQGVGLAEGALECATRYLAERRQFGQPLVQFQGLQFMLADLAIQVAAARQLAYAAARAYDAGAADLTFLAAAAKTFASDTAMRVTTDAVQLLGGYGYLRDFPVERMMRDAKVLQIFDGTNQIQRLVVARELTRGLS